MTGALRRPDAYVPSGHQLKAWLLGSQSINASHALFDIDASGIATIADLLGGDRYFADPDQVWIAQDVIIEARRLAFIGAGWPDAAIVPASDPFHVGA